MKHLSIYPDGGRRVESARGIRKLVLRFLPFHILSPLNYELRMAYVRFKQRNKTITSEMLPPEKRRLLVNVGAGHRAREDWINIDCFTWDNVDCVFDVRKKLPFADDLVRGLFVRALFRTPGLYGGGTVFPDGM